MAQVIPSIPTRACPSTPTGLFILMRGGAKVFTERAG